MRTAPAHLALNQTLGRFGIPAEVLDHVSFPTVYASSHTQKALAGSGIAVPDLESYAATLWTHWEEMLDDSITRDKAAVAALKGKTVVITGASSGIGLVTAVQVAKAGGGADPDRPREGQAGGHQGTHRGQGGKAYAYGCDLSDLQAIDALAEQLSGDFEPSTTSSTTPAARSGAH